jgi:hypothetical protein
LKEKIDNWGLTAHIIMEKVIDATFEEAMRKVRNCPI